MAKQFALIAAGFVLALICMSPAFAAVDFTPVINQGLDILNTGLLALATAVSWFLIRFLSSRVGLANTQLEATLAAQADEFIRKGIGMAYAVAKSKVNDPSNPLQKIEFDNVFVDMAARYAITAMPGIIDKFGLSKDRIEKMVIARLPDWMNESTLLTASTAVIAEEQSKKAATIPIA